MAINERDRRALILGGAALAVLAVYFGVVEPVWGRYERMVRTHDSAAEQLAKSVGKRQKQAFQREQVRAWEEKSGPLGAPKPYSEGITFVGSQIVGAAQSSGVEMQGATPGAATPWIEDPHLQQSIIQIEGKADWENVFKFISSLYRIEGVLSVEQMELNSSDPKKPGKLSLKLNVSVLLTAPSGGGAKWAS